MCARDKHWRRALLEKGKFEFFKANDIACLLQPLRHILCGAVVAGGASGAVAIARGGDVLQRPQMPKDTFARRSVVRSGDAA